MSENEERINDKVVYIAGPMTGYDEFNFPAFFAAEEHLKKYFGKIWNPARMDEEAGLDVTGTTGKHEEIPEFSIREAMKQNLSVICDECTDIYLLEGWEHSKGAQAEVWLARVLGLRIHLAPVSNVE